mmetsp:Transcript_22264/g.40398  ORF Transcript_22264/g.40398 Transcript_22264/m.40398 type:complete len:187 (+) Transcript_22264:2-562(+)
MLIRCPMQRPSMEQVLKMPFILQVCTPTSSAWRPFLPSLRPMLESARKVGAFDRRDLSKADSVDPLLQQLQRCHQNICLPDAEEGHSDSGEDTDEDQISRDKDAHLSKTGLVSDPDNSETCTPQSSNKSEYVVTKTVSTVSTKSNASCGVLREKESLIVGHAEQVCLGDSIIIGHAGLPVGYVESL